MSLQSRSTRVLTTVLEALILLLICGSFEVTAAQDAPSFAQDTTASSALAIPSPPFSLPPTTAQDPSGRFINELTVGLRLRQPLDERPPNRRFGLEQQGEFRASTTAEMWVRYVPVESWFAQVTSIGYLRGDQAPWDPEFTYAFGYDNWRSYTFSVTYSNYEGNKFSPDAGERFTHFDRGTLELSWKAPNPFRDWLLVHPSGDLQHRFSLLTSPEYVDQQNAEHNWKTRLALDTKYNVYKWWYVDFTAYVYPKSSQQQPWDPDFTYGFGYSDWHPGTLSVQYNNYSGTRWPWRSSSGTGRFVDGAVSVSWSYTL